ncbi:HAL protein kinase [Blastomyces gilchristii SLH14081]|uniref:non-specific serine/threonine protein kinase n=1 Tax=Blastomyces gilchristii (strain SLH14081) TaxID=559298 RepID=A0A179UK65_BLAGS|nr:HAL protein kinase [Blastomyces gilchristii SLH14081]OAT08456.1 HAL protein kinase [Blastomyces gilchristii SLH14081]
MASESSQHEDSPPTGRDNQPPPHHQHHHHPQQHQHPIHSAMATNSSSRPSSQHGQQAVRFASVNQEIEPAISAQESNEPSNTLQPPNDEIQSLSIQLQKSRLQEARLQNFSFDPVSLPASRVPSKDSGSIRSFRDHSRSVPISPTISGAQSPVLTPTGSGSREGKQGDQTDYRDGIGTSEQSEFTPQTSLSNDVPGKGYDSIGAGSRPSPSSEPSSTKYADASAADDARQSRTRKPKFYLAQSSEPESREPSPPPTQKCEPGWSTPVSGATTPGGDHNDPYSRTRRPPQPKSLSQIDPRFVFASVDAKRRANQSRSPARIPRSASGGDLKAYEKRGSFFPGRKDSRLGDSGGPHDGKSSGSMSELKRFFRMGNKHKRSGSPASSFSKKDSPKSAKHPQFQPAPVSIPFADDHGLQSKYGKLGRVLGSGAGGSVRLLKRNSDGVTFAVKQFRDRHSWENEKDYSKKVTAEFCIGSTLHHGNIIETMDIINEGGRWYEVMEFAPYDLFAIVMTGRMTREEIACSFLQILSGVVYLHGMGLAHRDLKLDNVVVSDRGIMKLIDFGSAVVFRYPFENDIVLATGVVGSDPYLAPEVYDEKRYDPRPTDIWSLAIIFCCMSLRRFPWKQPRMTDNSFKLFASPPSHQRSESETIGLLKTRPRSTPDLPSVIDASKRQPPRANERNEDARSSSRHRNHSRSRSRSRLSSNVTNAADQNTKSDESQPKSEIPPSQSSSQVGQAGQRPEVIKGPWRLLRILPRETRPLIAHMLKLNPRERATLQDVLADSWVRSCQVCYQKECGTVVHAANHTHVLEPPSAAPPPANDNNKKVKP